MKSPCILVCSIDEKTGFCHGCGRTRTEIGGWTSMTDNDRDEIMERLGGRLDQIVKKPRRVTKRQQLANNREDGSEIGE
ncbi:MAG: DUF1289 domain-containing protein [Pseudomonadota bacterium]